MPNKARILSTIDFLDKKGIKGFDDDMFWSNNVFHITGYKMSKSSNPYTFKNNLKKKRPNAKKKL